MGANDRARKAPMRAAPVLRWLLEPAEPSVRYLALTDLLGVDRSTEEAEATRATLGKVGWAARILSDRNPSGSWGDDDRFYQPKYRATNWQLLVLAELGLTREDPRIAGVAERWMARFAKPDGGFGTDGATKSHLCVTGNTARALLKFGYGDDPRVRSALRWILDAQMPGGGWSCLGSPNLDSWEGLSALAALPTADRTPEIGAAIARGAAFYLERELHVQGARYAPWYRFHFPVHYYYDLLVGLDLLTALGYGADRRLDVALGVMDAKQRPDGRWDLDAVHPDAEGAVGRWIRAHPGGGRGPLVVEPAGAPSKWITLTALRVRARVAAARPGARAAPPAAARRTPPRRRGSGPGHSPRPR